MTKHTKTLATLALTGAVTLSPMLALADVNANVTANASTSGNSLDLGMHASTSADRKQDREQKWEEKQHDRIVKEQDRGDHLIDKRINTLQKLEERINDMKRLTADQKSSIIADLNAQISALTSLRTKLAGDTSTTTLRADLKTIAPDYRVYILVLPRTEIVIAADRVMNIADEMSTDGAKLQARITAAQNAGVNVSAAQAAYADYNAKVADAKVQAQAAIDLVLKLNPDNGDKMVMAANTAALKSARTKLQAARTDLRNARHDMSKIMRTVRKHSEGHENVTASTTASTTHS